MLFQIRETCKIESWHSRNLMRIDIKFTPESPLHKLQFLRDVSDDTMLFLKKSGEKKKRKVVEILIL